VTVTHEEWIENQAQIKVQNQKPRINSPYFLYGECVSAQNLETLRAFQQCTVKLVLVGRKIFYQRIKELVHSLALDDQVVFRSSRRWGISCLYAHAIALVVPSRSEGFDSGLEALATGCPVNASDILVYHEILGDQATYFNPTNPQDLAEKLMNAVKQPKKVSANRIRLLLDTYSLPALGSDTHHVNERCLGVCSYKQLGRGGEVLALLSFGLTRPSLLPCMILTARSGQMYVSQAIVHSIRPMCKKSPRMVCMAHSYGF
jgi:hypothetical protein